MAGAAGIWWWAEIDSTSNRAKATTACAIVIMSYIASYALLGPELNAKLALVDEHDIPVFMGPSHQVEYSQIPRILVEKTEVGQFGESSRFRPVYYAVRLAEIAAWRTDAAYWYGWRIFLFGSVIAGIWWLCAQCVGVVLGTIITVYTLSFAMWSDIWARSTGPSEQYTAFGSIIFLLGAWRYIRRWREAGSLRSASVAMALGAIIAMGEKENMLILEAPLALALIAGLARRRLDVNGALALVVAILTGAWVVASITAFMLKNPVQDIYGNKPGFELLTSRTAIAVYVLVAAAMVLTVALDRVIAWYGGNGKLGDFRRAAGKNIILALVILAIFVSQYLFYTGHIPSHGRYDFPALLVLPALLILLFGAASEVAGLFLQKLTARKAVGTLLALGMLAYIPFADWGLPRAVAANVQRTTAFDSGLKAVLRRTSERPDWPLIVASYSPWDFEIVQGLGVIFTADGMTNPRFLAHLRNSDGESRTAFEDGVLDQALETESRDGFAQRGYRPIAEYEKYADAYCFVIALREPSRFVSDRNNGKGPKIGSNCVQLPMYIYWEGNTLHYESGIDHPDPSSAR